MEADRSYFYVKTWDFIPKLRFKPPGPDRRGWLHCRYNDLNKIQQHPQRRPTNRVRQDTKVELNSRHIINMHPGCAPEDLVTLNLMCRKLVFSKNLHNFMIFRNVKCIHAEANQLTLPEFQYFPALKELNLNCNCITRVPCLCDGWFTHLTKLDLSFNYISPLDLHHLGEIISLEDLNLSNNSLQYLTAAFGAPGNFPALRTLILENNELQNPITFLILSRLPKLERLSLGENNFNLVPCLLKHDYRAPFKRSDMESIKEEKQFFQLYEAMRTPRGEASDSDDDEPCRKPPNTPASSIDRLMSEVDTSSYNEEYDAMNESSSVTSYKKYDKVNAISDSTHWRDLALMVIKMRNNNASKQQTDGKFKPTHINGLSQCVRVAETEVPTLLRYCKDMAIFSVTHWPFPSLRELQLHKNKLTFGVDVMALVTWPQLQVADIRKNPVTAQASATQLLKDFVSTTGIVLVTNVNDRKTVNTALRQDSNYCLSKTTYDVESKVSKVFTSELQRTPSKTMFTFLSSVSGKYYKEELLESTISANLKRLKTWEKKQMLARLERSKLPAILPNAENIPDPKKEVKFQSKDKQREMTFSGTRLLDPEEELYTLKFDGVDPNVQLIYKNQNTEARCDVCQQFGECMCPIEHLMPGESIYLQVRRRKERGKTITCDKSCVPTTSNAEDSSGLTSLTQSYVVNISRTPLGKAKKKNKSRKPKTQPLKHLDGHPDNKWILTQEGNRDVDKLLTPSDQVHSQSKASTSDPSSKGGSTPVKPVPDGEDESQHQPPPVAVEEKQPSSKSQAPGGLRIETHETHGLQTDTCKTGSLNYIRFLQQHNKKLLADKEYLNSICGESANVPVGGYRELRQTLRREIAPHLNKKNTFKKTVNIFKEYLETYKIATDDAHFSISRRPTEISQDKPDKVETAGTSTGIVRGPETSGTKPKTRAPLVSELPRRADPKKQAARGAELTQKRVTTDVSAMEHATKRFYSFEPRNLNTDWQDLRDLKAQKKREEEERRRQFEGPEIDLSAGNYVFDMIVRHLQEQFPGIVINESTSSTSSSSTSSDDE